MIAIKRKPAQKRASAARSELTPELGAAVERLAGLELEFIEHDKFSRTNPDRAAAAVLASAEEPTTVGDSDEARRLTAEEESTWFEQMNWFKFWAARLRKQLLRRPTAELVTRIEQLLQASTKIRNRLIQMNLRLVPFVARNFVSPHHSLADLISDGQVTLIRSVEKFDFSRGFRFSTYATWALRFTLARNISDARRRRARFTNIEQISDAIAPEVDEAILRESAYPAMKDSIAGLLAQLDPREQEIVRSRFGIARLTEEETLKAIARRMGVCKERVRQLEIRAISKLRKLVDQAGVHDETWVSA
ncbi:MAG: sigma-70 family RNA polymerase sigma factor [Planctomycetaceae bacterium]|nr:sigma-70 family RNA polymerase sigma factor [Planctomycetaceae bacterium]